MATENNNNTPKENQGPQSEGRRNALKALATIPVLGALGYGVYKKQTYDKKSKSLGSAFKFDKEHYMIPAQPDGKKIRIGDRFRYPWQAADACSRFCRTFLDRRPD